MPKSPKPLAENTVNGKSKSQRQFSSGSSSTLSPAQESEEIAYMIAYESDKNESDSEAGLHDSDDWEEDLEEEEGGYGSSGDVSEDEDGGVVDDVETPGSLISSTMSKFDQLEASWRVQLRSSGFHG